MGAGRIQIAINVAGLAWELLFSLHNSTPNCRDHPEVVTFYSMLLSNKSLDAHVYMLMHTQENMYESCCYELSRLCFILLFHISLSH